MLLALLLAQLAPANPAGPIVTNPATMRRLAFFEAFPASGAGTNGACSTTPPTGAKGEALTFTRGSTATCTKTATGGLATTGIANGDLVVMASNQPRVEYDSGRKLKLLVESSRKNSTLRSQELDNAAWAYSNSDAPRLPVLNGADTIVAPDGTTTAEDYSFAAIAGTADYGYRYQPSGCPPGVASTLSVYAKSISGGTTIDLTIETGAGTWTSASCAISTTSWTRCVLPNIMSRAVAAALYVGVGQAGAVTTRSAARVALWGGDCEAGSYATSYIPTTSAAVTRSAETASFSGSSWPTATYSVAATVARMANTNGAVLDGVSSGGVGLLFFSGLRQRHSPGPTDVAGAISFTANAPSRFAASYTGTTGQVFQDGVSVAGPSAQTAPSAWPSSVYLGLWSVAASTADGLYGEICLDPNPLRCR